MFSFRPGREKEALKQTTMDGATEGERTNGKRGVASPPGEKEGKLSSRAKRKLGGGR